MHADFSLYAQLRSYASTVSKLSEFLSSGIGRVLLTKI